MVRDERVVQSFRLGENRGTGMVYIDKVNGGQHRVVKGTVMQVDMREEKGEESLSEGE